MSHPVDATVLFVAGTRPEVVKLAPVIERVRGVAGLRAVTCLSGQHRELVESVLGPLRLEVEVDLRSDDEEEEAASLSVSVARLLERLDAPVRSVAPDAVVVQGDTNTALAGALVAFHQERPCFHVEAGLRTSRANTPFPEEMNRRLIASIATLHFAPTESARQNLLKEGVPPDSVFCTGNPVVDALHRFGAIAPAPAARPLDARRQVLVTLHRRESAPIAAALAQALRRLVERRDDVEVTWILHLNPIRRTIRAELDDHHRIALVEPRPYADFIALLSRSHVALTDSGGVQEEAPVLGVPVLVIRPETERPELVERGHGAVVGTDCARILAQLEALLDDGELRASMATEGSPFGDGRAAERIAEHIAEFFDTRRGASP